MKLMIDNNFEYFETNHSLETNLKVLQQWKFLIIYNINEIDFILKIIDIKKYRQ